MPTYTVRGKDPATALRDLKKLIRKHMRERSTRIGRAVRRAARKGAAVVRKNVPVAFSELRDSVDAEGTRIVVSAPHAAAVNDGSRPHFPPLDALEKWVKLRGKQGLMGPKQIARLPGPTSAGSAHAAARSLKAQETKRSPHLSVDAPRRVAFLIARAISKRGTRPHRYMEASFPAIVNILDIEVRAAIPDK